MSEALINRSLTNIRTELDFLLENRVISKDFYDEFNRRLPRDGGKQNKTKRTNTFVEAIYPYEPQQPDDLRLNVGDKIEILEVLSESWLRGKCNDQIGVFPSNYVKPINKYNNNNNNNNNSAHRHSAPLPNKQYGNNGKFSNQYNNHTQTPPPSYSPPQQQNQQKPEKKHDHQLLHQFGSKLGNAIIWGAGSRFGQDLVNSAFDKLNDREIQNDNQQ